MTPFEIISIILGCLAVLGGLIAIWIKTSIAIAKIEVRIVELQHDLDSKEIAILKIERDNKEDFRDNKTDHNKILEKVDRLIESLIK